jgi:hypothetical protein
VAGTGLVRKIEPGFQPRIDDLSADLLATFGPSVVRVQFVGGLGDAPRQGLSVWLGTLTDAERDALAAEPDLASTTRVLVERSGLFFRGVSVESQETVDRDYEGSWFYRLR